MLRLMSTVKPVYPTRAKAGAPAAFQVTLTTDGKAPELAYSEQARDPWKVLNHALCAVIRVSQSSDAHYALEASKFLVEYAVNAIDRRQDQRAQEAEKRLATWKRDGGRPVALAEPVDRQAILDELKGLYAKALGPAPLIVEAEPEEPAASPAKPASKS